MAGISTVVLGAAHDEGSTLGQGGVGVAHGGSDMVAVVGLHSLLQAGERGVVGLVVGHVDLGRSGPDDHDAGAVVLLLEVADVLTQGLHHLPSRESLLDVVARDAFGVVGIKGSLHGHDLLQLVAHGLDVLGLEHLGIDGSLVGVLGIGVPRAEDDVVELGQLHDIAIVQVLLLRATSDTDLVVLGHGSHRLGEALANHQHSRHKGRGDGAATYNHDAEFALGGFHFLFHYYLLILVLLFVCWFLSHHFLGRLQRGLFSLEVSLRFL